MINPSYSEKFENRHNAPDEAQIKAMLNVVKARSVDELIGQTVPGAIRLKKTLNLPGARSEHEFLNSFKKTVSKNKIYKSYIGTGYYNCITPGVILRNILENPAWYTAYTPYQAEISQGRMEALINFQTMCADLTGMEIANASLLDEGTAAAEAMTLAKRSAKSKSNTFFVSNAVHPQTLEVLKTRAEAMGIDLHVGDDSEATSVDSYGVLLQYPNTFGQINDYKALADAVHKRHGVVCVATDLD